VSSAQILVLDGDTQLDVRDVVATLRRAGFARIVAEGGPTLAAQLLESGAVDEVCLTVMPRIGGPSLPLFTSAPLGIHDVVPHTLIADDTGAQFGRWSIAADS
jgi:riboflavin biosynthesis pyrimidine reductase